MSSPQSCGLDEPSIRFAAGVSCRRRDFLRTAGRVGMRRADCAPLPGSTAVPWPLGARAEQGGRIRRIGVLMSAAEGGPRGLEYITAFAQGLAELGWMVGRNMRIEFRW